MLESGIGLPDRAEHHHEPLRQHAGAQRLAQRIGIRDVIARRPLRFEHGKSAYVVIATDEGHVGFKEFCKNLTDPLEDLLTILRRCRHEFFCNLSDQFVESTLVQQKSLARRQGRHVAEQRAEGLRERTLTTRPGTTVSSNDQAELLPVPSALVK